MSDSVKLRKNALNDQATAKDDPLLGQVVADRFRLLQCIGKGGMGAVYKAEHLVLKSHVAVKVLAQKRMKDAVHAERFRREAQTLAKVRDERCVSVIDYGEAFNTLWIAMEFVDGVTLWEEQRICGPFDVARTLKVITQLLGGLAAIHEAGIVHRDVKPQNIMLVQKAADRDLVKIVDFGIAKLVDNDSARALTAPGTLFGTPEYMSPEQARGDPLDPRADIYSAGVVAFQMLLGNNPYRGMDARDTLQKVHSLMPPPIAESRPDVMLPEGMEKALQKMVAKEPALRFQSAQQAVDTLMRLPAIGAVRRPAAVSTMEMHAPSERPVPLQTPLASPVKTQPWLPAAAPEPVTTSSPPSSGHTAEWFKQDLELEPRQLSARTFAGYSIGFIAVMAVSAYATFAFLTRNVTPPPPAVVKPAQPIEAVAPSTPAPEPQAAPIPEVPAGPTQESKDRAAAELRRGLRLLEAGRDDEAIRAFEKAVGDDPSVADAHLKLGVLLYRKSQYAKSREHYQRYLELRPDAPNAAQIQLVLEALKTAP